MDVFDTYSIEIIQERIQTIKGIKLQASILDNKEVLQCLESIEVGDTEALINISGYSLNQISSYIEIFSICVFNSATPSRLSSPVGRI